MQVRPIRPDERDLFVKAAGSKEHSQEITDYLTRMFSAGSMRPEWCFVAEDGDHLLGRVAFWTLPGVDHPFALVLLDVVGDDFRSEVGRSLLRDVLERARKLGSGEIEHVLDSPLSAPQFQHHPEERMALLEDFGFSLQRETYRVEWTGTETPEMTDRLSFRTLEEVGEEEFVAAIMAVSEGSLDADIRSERESLGPLGAAQDFFDDARKVEHEPSWWRLAYEEPGGKLAGLIMTAKPPTFLTIFYIGVVPEMRGRGYVNDLLAPATRILLEADTTNDIPLRADTDTENSPMLAAFERAGWKHFANRREYVLSLEPDTDSA